MEPFTDYGLKFSDGQIDWGYESSDEVREDAEWLRKLPSGVVETPTHVVSRTLTPSSYAEIALSDNESEDTSE